eukprot:1088411-Pyramimonas_sp.AAC.1
MLQSTLSPSYLLIGLPVSFHLGKCPVGRQSSDNPEPCQQYSGLDLRESTFLLGRARTLFLGLQLGEST